MWLNVQWLNHPLARLRLHHEHHEHRPDSINTVNGKSSSDTPAETTKDGGAEKNGMNGTHATNGVTVAQSDLFQEIEHAIFEAAFQSGVLVCKGSWFQADSVHSRTPSSSSSTDRSLTLKSGTHSGESESKVNERFEGKGTEGERGMFFRTTFAAAKENEMEEGIRRLGHSLRKEFLLLPPSLPDSI